MKKLLKKRGKIYVKIIKYRFGVMGNSGVGNKYLRVIVWMSLFIDNCR